MNPSESEHPSNAIQKTAHAAEWGGVTLLLIVGVVIWFFTGFHNTNRYKVVQCQNAVIEATKPTVLYGTPEVSAYAFKQQQDGIRECQMRYSTN